MDYKQKLVELEALPAKSFHQLCRDFPNCPVCGKSMPYGSAEILVYRKDGKNISAEEALANPHDDDNIEEVTTAHVCMDCGDKLYS